MLLQWTDRKESNSCEVSNDVFWKAFIQWYRLKVPGQYKHEWIASSGLLGEFGVSNTEVAILQTELTIDHASRAVQGGHWLPVRVRQPKEIRDNQVVVYGTSQWYFFKKDLSQTFVSLTIPEVCCVGVDGAITVVFGDSHIRVTPADWFWPRVLEEPFLVWLHLMIDSQYVSDKPSSVSKVKPLVGLLEHDGGKGMVPVAANQINETLKAIMQALSEKIQ